jgi:formate/nitrite transporter FocA (FNT family)
VPPVAAFVAAGFEHSIANMYGRGPLSHGRPTWDDHSGARRVERRATP